MLRPQSNRFLGSSRAERSRNMRRERVRAVSGLFDAVRGAVLLVTGVVVALVLLWGMPILYAASSFLVLALPLRWLTGRSQPTWLTMGELTAALAIAAIGLLRAAQGAEPIAPVRRVFARTMLGLCWLGALLLAAADVWGHS